jgi:site-specific DNA recombinase
MSVAFASKRVAIYARYSSSLQNERSIEDQVRRCTEHVRAAGGNVDEGLIFTDMAISAASLKRPGFEMLMRAVAERRVDTIVAEDLSRISRDLADSATLFKKLQHVGVPLIGVADGIDTGSKGAKVNFTMRSLVADVYLDDLRDKTKRGLEGRCRAGYSTGGLPFGYRTEAALAPDGRELGRRIIVDEDAAVVVRRVFALYLSGLSYAAIAKLFNAEGVPYARLKTKHRRKGWVASSVRAMVWNRAYAGEWSYNKREWRKNPETNARQPHRREAADVIVQNYPERRIVSPEVWESVRARASAVATRYRGERGKVVAPGNKTRYLFSGLLFCGSCGAAMTITAGTSARYYACGDARKRGTCSNRSRVREDAVRMAVLAALHAALFTAEAVAFLRRRIVERLRAATATNTNEISILSSRLQRTRERIRGLVTFIADGDESASVREALRDLEAQARIDGDSIEALRVAKRSPVRLPSPEDLLIRARDLERVIAAEPMRGREALRSVLHDGKVTMFPQDDGSYVADVGFQTFATLGGSRMSRDAEEVGRTKIAVPKPFDRRRRS